MHGNVKFFIALFQTSRRNRNVDGHGLFILPLTPIGWAVLMRLTEYLMDWNLLWTLTSQWFVCCLPSTRG